MIQSGQLLPTKQLILDLLEKVNASIEEACVAPYISRPLGTVSHLFSLLLLPAGYRLVIFILLMCYNHDVLHNLLPLVAVSAETGVWREYFGYRYGNRVCEKHIGYI